MKQPLFTGSAVAIVTPFKEGGVVTAGFMRAFGGRIPTPALLVLMAAVSLAAGCVWGVIPAAFKAKWG